MPEAQSLANHRRFDPWYHVAAFGLLALALILAIVHLCHRRPSSHWEVIITLAVLLVWFKVRSYALRVQDRVIRLEERLRMQTLLPEALKARIPELKPAQLVALRFASDAELAARVAEALEKGLASTAIKQQINHWRPDTFRV